VVSGCACEELLDGSQDEDESVGTGHHTPVSTVWVLGIICASKCDACNYVTLSKNPTMPVQSSRMQVQGLQTEGLVELGWDEPRRAQSRNGRRVPVRGRGSG